MRDAGVRLIADSSTWGSIGILEGVSKFPKVYPAARAVAAHFRAGPPDLYVPVDYRVFSMKCAGYAKQHGIPVVYYFAPVNWFGSGSKRFEMMKGIVDLALLAIPLSIEEYREAGIPVEYIGHPLADAAKPSMEKEEAREFFGVGTSGPVVGLMPGSRTQEVARLMPVFAGAVRMISGRLPGAQFLLFRAADSLGPLIERHIAGLPVKMADRNVYDFMNVSDLLVLCSGTAAHEATLMRTPMIVTYRLSWFTAWLARRTVNPPMIALPNILAGEFVAPELVQEECTPENIAGKAVEMLSRPEISSRMKDKLERVALGMGEPGAAARAAARILDILDTETAAGSG